MVMPFFFIFLLDGLKAYGHIRQAANIPIAHIRVFIVFAFPMNFAEVDRPRAGVIIGFFID
jgi:hypothetical protein